jgi:hypothetical protein
MLDLLGIQLKVIWMSNIKFENNNIVKNFVTLLQLLFLN